MEFIPIISFFTGVISILSPCILAILPIFVAFSLKSKTKTELFSFVLGLFSVFTIIIFLTGFFTAIVYHYIVYVRILAALILLVIGIMILFDYSLSFKSVSYGGEGLLSSFILGFLTSIAWAPCYSGYLISLIGLLVASNDPFYAVGNIIIYCIGFALTLLVLSLIINKIDLERLIDKTKYISQVFGVLVIFGALYLLYESLLVLF
ncbi:cytochrome c biogenesis CcdA family protein [uncultured Methanobrevibacter sp.]|uniref:cytochrome c biogenesis CcdA family protein n=1 Tax=uncultured Methanobrevibacter sp. TaxID=253161 RepID=UPI0026329390